MLNHLLNKQKKVKKKDKKFKYIYPNQISDATNVFGLFMNNPNRRCQKISKNATGLITYIYYSFGIHPHEYYGIDSENMLLMTGFNNKQWKKDTKKIFRFYGG